MQTKYPASALLLASALLAGCGDNPVGRWMGAVGGCMGGNAYQFALSGSPTVTWLHIEGQLPVITATVPLNIGRPCEALQGGSSNLAAVRVLRNGSPLQATGAYELGAYQLRFAEQIMPSNFRYEVQGLTDNSPTASVLGRTTFDMPASTIQGFARIAVSNASLPQARLTWNAVSGHTGYRLRFTYADPAAGGQQLAIMNVAPNVTSYQLGSSVQGDPTIEEGRTIGLPAAIADARNTGLKPGLKLSVSVSAFRFEPGTGANRLNSGFDWEHRSLPISLTP